MSAPVGGTPGSFHLAVEGSGSTVSLHVSFLLASGGSCYEASVPSNFKIQGPTCPNRAGELRLLREGHAGAEHGQLARRTGAWVLFSVLL